MEPFVRLTDMLLTYLFPRAEGVEKLHKLSLSELSQLPPSQALGDPDTIALFEYAHHTVKEIVWQVKYKGNRDLAKKVGILLYDTIMAELEERNIFAKFPNVLLIPMPTSAERRLERGWNQAELLAQALLSDDNGHKFVYLPHAITKIRHTESQTKATSRSERLENLRNSMRVASASPISGKCVVLLDDVTTTGATFAEARHALKEAGAKKIICVALAH